MHIPVAKRPPGSKILPRAEEGMFVGYTEADHQYRIFVSEKKQIVISADVKFLPYQVDNFIAETASTFYSLEMNQPDLATSSLTLNSWSNSHNLEESKIFEISIKL